MLSCIRCQRFLREDAQGCPFCGTARVTAIAPVVLAVAIGVALVACGPSVGVVDGDGGGGDTTADDGSATSPTTNTTTNTSANTTVATTIDQDTSTATISTSDDDATADDGAAFYGGSPDGGNGTLGCDVWAQDCMEGHKCMPYANDGGDDWNATICVPVDGTPGAPGDPCTAFGNPYSGFDDCDLGAMCWNVDPETNEGTCVANCGGTEANPECEDPSTQCLIAYDGVIHVCAPQCDPLLQDCPTAATCVPWDHTFFCAPDNSGAGGAAGDGCEDFNDCDPGMLCVDAMLVPDCADTSCCTEFCDITLPDADAMCSAAAEGVQCEPYFEDPNGPMQVESVGACVIPS